MSTSIAYETVPSRGQTDMGTKTLWTFLALTFGLSWVPMSLFIVFADQLTPMFGEMSSHQPVLPAGCVRSWHFWNFPDLAPLRAKRIGELLSTPDLWRAPVQWWLFLLLGIPAIIYAAAAIKGTIHDPFPFAPGL